MGWPGAIPGCCCCIPPGCGEYVCILVIMLLEATIHEVELAGYQFYT